MLELIIGILAISAVVKIASADGQNAALWGLVTFVLVAACVVLIPLPMLRVGIGAILAFLAMFAYKVAANK
jgi:hypothetical protein